MDKCNGCGGASEKKDDEAGTNVKEMEGGRCDA